MRPLAAAVVALASLVAISPLSAQKKGSLPKRPKLQATTDTNDAAAYYQLGQQMLDRDARTAADAFYWATRLNPNSAEALYGLRTARHLSDMWRFQRYMADDRKTIESRDVRQIDSLLARALMLNPFLYRKFDELMFRKYIHHSVNSSSPGSDRPMSSEVDHWIDLWLQRAGPETRAWVAYGGGRFGDALRGYAEAMKGTKRHAYLRTERGRIFFLLGNPDSALAELNLALDELRKKDNKELVRLYDSKAVLEHSIAKIHEARDDVAAAREAYGRALEEDLAFYPAHLALANLALQTGDTTTGLSEMELAVQINGDDAVLRLIYAYVLAASKRYADAEAHLAKAIAVEPYFPNPYHVLGQVYESQKKRPEAIAQYEAFLQRAAMSHPMREEAVRRLGALRTQVSGSKE
ncbi:MAG: tetratricopeptide repeat protein [Gemmatimonadota bacterium]|nr:tetratricopeptide repeat protein [Gemmatimonadota bacterium]